MIKAEIIADSKNEFGNRITSFVCVFPRIILAEINTHRMLSRNSASSRAIPFEKMLQRVQEDPFIPIKWMKDHSGMQGNEYLDERDSEVALSTWLMAKERAIDQAKHLSERGVTKQIVNRLLEPFMWHTAIITATEWENFFALRAHEAAEIHLQNLAHKMLEAMNNSTPKQLKAGEWHAPFGDKFDYTKLQLEVLDTWNKRGDSPSNAEFFLNAAQEAMVLVSTARNARVTYLNFEGKDDYRSDILLHDRLLASGHMSPFEHCARAMNADEFHENVNGHRSKDGSDEDAPYRMDYGANGWSGNFRGFMQYRKMLTGENKIDNRLKK